MVAEVKSIELKNKQQLVGKNALSAKRVQEFIADVKAEVQKITWTSRDELIFYTNLVVSATFVVGMMIYGLDLLIQAALGSLNFLLHFITG